MRHPRSFVITVSTLLGMNVCVAVAQASAATQKDLENMALASILSLSCPGWDFNSELANSEISDIPEKLLEEETAKAIRNFKPAACESVDQLFGKQGSLGPGWLVKQ